MDGNFRIWSGVYRSLAEAPAFGPGFSGEEHRRRSIAAATEAIASVTSGVPMRRWLTQRSLNLPSIVASGPVDDIAVLDFGGGLGIGYLTLLETVPGIAERLTYHIVDLPETCEVGRELFADMKGISFSEELPPVGQSKFGIVYSSSALQYVEDWRGVLEALASYRAPSLLLSDVFAGDVPTFATLQRYYDSAIPQWFWNVGEFVDCLAGAGYDLRLRLSVAITRLGRADGLEMDNFEPRYRIPETLNLLFKTVGA